MDFSGRVVLSAVEEDNIQRAYFRVRPLLSIDGAVPGEDLEALPDNGYLRVVPDKNEQHTFKDRMREMGGFCVLNLADIPPDAVKIRPNKNYAPQKGESNQFIVYSDAVREIPARLFYEVVTADAGDKEKIGKSVTPFCYMRCGGRIFGPVSKATGLEQEGAALLPPDSEGLFSVTLPDGSEKLFYWPRSEQAEGKKEEEAAAAVPEENASEEMKLNGMPLYASGSRRQTVPQRAHNALADAVGQQLRSGQTEAPGAVISSSADLHPVSNPMEAFRSALDTLWANPDMQRQAAAQFLTMTGVQSIISQQLCGGEVDAVTHAIDQQIRDLEAERLALLMQVDSARRDLSGLRQNALQQAETAEKEKLNHLNAQVDAVRTDLENAEIERAKLLKKRDELIARMNEGDPETCYVGANAGGYADLDTLCSRLVEALACAGAVCTPDDALHILGVLYASPDLLEVVMDSPSDALEAAGGIAAALGSEVYGDARRLIPIRGGDGCIVAVASAPRAPQRSLTWIIADANPQKHREERRDLYARCPWPVVRLKASAAWTHAAETSFSPVKVSAVKDVLEKDRTEPPQSALDLIDEMDRRLQNAGSRLPHRMRRQIYEYLSVTGARMNGGIADALDYAVCSWVVPCFMAGCRNTEVLASLLGGLPRAQEMLGKGTA